MATSSSASSHKQAQANSSGSEDQTVDIRKRKRMISNRESARRSRLRKQKHLDDLTAQVSHLRAQNGQILVSTNATTQHYLHVEAENSILRAQLAELTNRLNSLNDIIRCLSNNNSDNNRGASASMVSIAAESDDQESFDGFDVEVDDGFSINNWGFSFASVYPMVPALDAFMC